MTPDTPEQERAKKRDLGILRLKSKYIKGLTGACLAPWQKYGGLMEKMYGDTVKNTPDREAYNQLFKGRLLNGEAISSDSLKNDANVLTQQSLGDIEMGDLYKLMGIRTAVGSAYRGKLISELDVAEAKKVVGHYLDDLVEGQVEGVAKGRRKDIRVQLKGEFSDSGPASTA